MQPYINHSGGLHLSGSTEASKILADGAPGKMLASYMLNP